MKATKTTLLYALVSGVFAGGIYLATVSQSRDASLKVQESIEHLSAEERSEFYSIAGPGAKNAADERRLEELLELGQKRATEEHR